MKALIIILSLLFYEYRIPAPLEARAEAGYVSLDSKRKVTKRKKGKPLNRKAPYLINSVRNLRKVNTFNRQSQYPGNRTPNVKKGE